MSRSGRRFAASRPLRGHAQRFATGTPRTVNSLYEMPRIEREGPVVRTPVILILALLGMVEHTGAQEQEIAEIIAAEIRNRPVAGIVSRRQCDRDDVTCERIGRWLWQTKPSILMIRLAEAVPAPLLNPADATVPACGAGDQEESHQPLGYLVTWHPVGQIEGDSATVWINRECSELTSRETRRWFSRTDAFKLIRRDGVWRLEEVRLVQIT